MADWPMSAQLRGRPGDPRRQPLRTLGVPPQMLMGTPGCLRLQGTREPLGCTADKHQLGWLIFPRSSAVLGKDPCGILCTVSALSPGVSSSSGPHPPTNPPGPRPLRWPGAGRKQGEGEGLLSGVLGETTRYFVVGTNGLVLNLFLPISS